MKITNDEGNGHERPARGDLGTAMSRAKIRPAAGMPLIDSKSRVMNSLDEFFREQQQAASAESR
jgi:hypothetical protein